MATVLHGLISDDELDDLQGHHQLLVAVFVVVVSAGYLHAGVRPYYSCLARPR